MCVITNNTVKIITVLFLVNLIILSTYVETFIIPTTNIDGDNNNNNINESNCITNCSVKHKICAKWCPKYVENIYENQNISEDRFSFSMINAPDMCPRGEQIDGRGRCRKVVT